MSFECSNCVNNGGISKTCLESNGGFKLFGVRFSAECCTASSPGIASECSSSSSTAMRKSVSMGNLSNYRAAAEGAGCSLSPSQYEQADPGDPVEGYASDDLVHSNSSCRERKKGVPWTEEEHRTFLLGLQKLGKGDWRGISRNFVKTRTPTQVASHAQKYFLRRNNVNKRRRRSSLFDITPDTVSTLLEEPVLEETGADNPDVCAELSLGQSIPYGPPHVLDASCFSRICPPLTYVPVSIPVHQFPVANIPSGASGHTGISCEGFQMDGSENVQSIDGLPHGSGDVDNMEVDLETVEKGEEVLNLPPPFQQIPTPYWLGEEQYSAEKQELWGFKTKIVKPTPIIPKPPQKMDDARRISELAMNMTRRVMEPTPLSYKLLEDDGSRHSAFHVTTPSNNNRDVDSQGTLSSAISVP
ncbi:hypothetical protein KP509_16G031800 [Ceratopteris richardii]|uniref:Uncharacterized protein n=1 Tax=Ceratopteris richardii TaxID=49495 RepID=A0A8T2T3D4_CERRI|nr:hypothetical protein KP509_16G031800 [Ceratopteris richardii]